MQCVRCPKQMRLSRSQGNTSEISVWVSTTEVPCIVLCAGTAGRVRGKNVGVAAAVCALVLFPVIAAASAASASASGGGGGCGGDGCAALFQKHHCGGGYKSFGGRGSTPQTQTDRSKLPDQTKVRPSVVRVGRRAKTEFVW